jgi:hypothetical protein
MTNAGFWPLLLFLFRYVSIKLSPVNQANTKEAPMKKVLTAIKGIGSICMETMWAIGASSVATHLSA